MTPLLFSRCSCLAFVPMQHQKPKDNISPDTFLVICQRVLEELVWACFTATRPGLIVLIESTVSFKGILEKRTRTLVTVQLFSL